MKEQIWLRSLREMVLKFLGHMRSDIQKGYYRYSYSGDLYSEEKHWNLGSSVFALKIYHTLNVPKNEHIKNIGKYILSFRKKNGEIYDEFIYRRASLPHFFSCLRHMNFSNLRKITYRRADTRQSYSALSLYHLPVSSVRFILPHDTIALDGYLSRLNWYQPWHAGSQFSHLMFFYLQQRKSNHLSQDRYEALIQYAIEWVNRLQHRDDGCWYKGDVPLRIKLNGAMKIITALLAIDRLQFDYPEKLVDYALRAEEDEHACDLFNTMLVLNYASKLLGRTYRQGEIEKFALKKLSVYRRYYHEEEGGFSFFLNRANSNYYGVKITRGRYEPDIHGTMLFLWGISLIVQILKEERNFEFKEVTA